MAGNAIEQRNNRVNSKVALEVIDRDVSGPPSADFSINHTEGLAKVRRVSIAERNSIRREKGERLTTCFELQMVDTKNDKEKGDAEIQAYEDFLKEKQVDPGDTEAVHRAVIEAVFGQKIFTEHYNAWAKEYKKTPEFPELKDYIAKCAMDFIDKRRNQAIEAYLPNKTDGDKQIAALAIEFINKNEEDLLTYSSLNPKDPAQKQQRDNLFNRFLAETGIDKQKGTEIFEALTHDVQFAFIAHQKLEARLGVMMDMAARGDATEDEWAKGLEKADRKHRYLGKGPEQASIAATTVSASLPAEVSKQPATPEFIQQISKDAGILIGDLQKDGTYPIQFADHQFGDFRTHLQVLPDKTFLLKDTFVDSGKDQWVKLDAKTLVSGCNRIFLYNVLHSISQIHPEALGGSNPNLSTIGNEQMTSIAKNFFNGQTDIHEKPLEQKQSACFAKLMQIMLRKVGEEDNEKYGSFENRVKAMDTALNDPSRASAIYGLLYKLPSAGDLNVAQLLEPSKEL